ncbi:MAG: 4Fe-4S dicluster domain-containing protein, partial [Desulfobacterales bacterium]|nr:4Fe-4S dicluster domain-containing protein [Desulfobacterales bacterium]
MAHHTNKSGYARLVDRLNLFPQGAPPSMLLDKILTMLFSETDARLVSLLPIKPVTAGKAARIWKMSLSKARKVLDRLASRAILVDIDQKGQTQYVLPPPMAGFFEFSMMRVRHDIDQKVLSELFYQYLNVEEDFIKSLFTVGDTQLGRVFIHEPVLSNENAIHVLDYERASQVIKTASHRGISTCYCRHKMYHIGKACDRPMDICMTFNTSGRSLIKYGHARAVGVSEGLDLLEKAYESNLVQFGENVRDRVNFICNCCGCCCEAMIAARRFSTFNPIHTSNFIPKINSDSCTGCGKCVTICPVEAMTLVSANDPKNLKKKTARLNKDICLGCGLCVRACTEDSLELKPLPQRVITPLNGTHRAVVMAIERGKLQHLIFDNKVLFSHRALAAVLGVILKLPPVKQ